MPRSAVSRTLAARRTPARNFGLGMQFYSAQYVQSDSLPVNFNSLGVGTYAFLFRQFGQINTNRQIFTMGQDRLDVNLENTTNRIFVFFYDGTTNTLIWKSTKSVFDDQWHVILVRKTLANVDVYFDSPVPVATVAVPTNPSNTGLGKAKIGEAPVLIDHLAMWNVALTDAEIAEYFGSLIVPSRGVVLDWRFNDLNQSIIKDSSSSANNGTNTSGIYTDSVMSAVRQSAVQPLFNGGFETAPSGLVPTTSSNRIIDGTAGGSAMAGDQSGITFLAQRYYRWKVDSYGTTGWSVSYDNTDLPTALGSKSTRCMLIQGTRVQERVNLTLASRIYPDLSYSQDIMTNCVRIFPNTVYELRYKVKQSVANVVSDNPLNNGCGVIIHQHNNNGFVAGGTVRPSNPMSSFDWQEVVYTFTSNANARFLNICPGVFGGNTNYADFTTRFDDITLTMISGQGRAVVV